REFPSWKRWSEALSSPPSVAWTRVPTPNSGSKLAHTRLARVSQYLGQVLYVHLMNPNYKAHPHKLPDSRSLFLGHPGWQTLEELTRPPHMSHVVRVCQHLDIVERVHLDGNNVGIVSLLELAAQRRQSSQCFRTVGRRTLNGLQRRHPGL